MKKHLAYFVLININCAHIYSKIRLGDEYTGISEHANVLPLNTAELMEYSAYELECETHFLYAMEDKLRELLRQILILSDYQPLQSMEIKQNNFTFQR